MKQKDIEVIEKNLKAFLSNFEPISIKQGQDKAFYVFPDPNDLSYYVQRCENVDYLNGWLYGAVQAKNKMLKPKEQIDLGAYQATEIFRGCCL